MPRLFSYVVARDTGFAPNPFHGYCTLATCKPRIRDTAEVGDWVIGTDSKQRRRAGFLVYAMRVTETLTLDEYWRDVRFAGKRPNADGQPEERCGDNIYHFDRTCGQWRQKTGSFHCGTDVGRDTKVDCVLVSDDFVYFGGDGPPVPEFCGVNVCCVTQGHKCRFPEEVVESAIEWVRGLGDTGRCGQPSEMTPHLRLERAS